MKFLFDANMLLAIGKYRVDIFDEISKFGRPEACTLDLVVRELEEIRSRGGGGARHARLALQIIEQKGIEIIKSDPDGNTDKEIERAAKERDLVVCTQDRGLARRLNAAGVRVLILRQNRYFEML